MVCFVTSFLAVLGIGYAARSGVSLGVLCVVNDVLGVCVTQYMGVTL